MEVMNDMNEEGKEEELKISRTMKENFCLWHRAK
jgi:hypothetical protein